MLRKNIKKRNVGDYEKKMSMNKWFYKMMKMMIKLTWTMKMKLIRQEDYEMRKKLLFLLYIAYYHFLVWSISTLMF